MVITKDEISTRSLLRRHRSGAANCAQLGHRAGLRPGRPNQIGYGCERAGAKYGKLRWRRHGADGALNNAAHSGLQLTFEDHGPGIADVELALQDGYTTGDGLGLGLGGARRLANEFEIDPARERGREYVSSGGSERSFETRRGERDFGSTGDRDQPGGGGTARGHEACRSGSPLMRLASARSPLLSPKLQPT